MSRPREHLSHTTLPQRRQWWRRSDGSVERSARSELAPGSGKRWSQCIMEHLDATASGCHIARHIATSSRGGGCRAGRSKLGGRSAGAWRLGDGRLAFARAGLAVFEEEEVADRDQDSEEDQGGVVSVGKSGGGLVAMRSSLTVFIMRQFETNEKP